jgi:serine/threonine protein kinase
MSDEVLPADEPALVGAIVSGKYRVLRPIGSGGMGTVWEGVHVNLGTRVAIKFIRPQFAMQAEARTRFEIEARAAARLNTKHAVNVYDYGLTHEGVPYIVMEYLEGESLSDAVMARGPIPAQEVALVIGQAARALSKAHAAGIVHRDLKPDNIFLAQSDEPVDGLPYLVKLVDFGVAKMFDVEVGDEIPAARLSLAGPTREGTVIGTPNFMAPEQLTVGGAPGALTDLWSLGACTFAAMTGRLPFEGDIIGDIVLKVCVAPLPVPSQLAPHLPATFDAWFARACSRDPARRFQTAEELAEALAAACGSGRLRVATLDEDQIQYVLRAQPISSDTPELRRAPMSPRAALLAGVILGIAAMVGVMGFLAWQSQAGSPPPPSSPSTHGP